MPMAKLWVAALTLVIGAACASGQNVAAPQTDAGPGPIAALQQRLKEAGYDPGPVNGVMTEKTRAAMAAYRQRIGASASSAADPDPVERAQAALQRLGLFDGAIDGAVGAQTRDAIVRFQVARHLPVDPRISDRLLADLDAAAPAAPPPDAAAPAPEPPSEALGRRPLPGWVNPPPVR